MFGLGTWEILLILVAALVFIGPKKLPDLARTVGKGVRELRQAMSGLEREVQKATHIPDEPASKSEPEGAPDKAEGRALDEREGDDLGDKPGVRARAKRRRPRPRPRPPSSGPGRHAWEEAADAAEADDVPAVRPAEGAVPIGWLQDEPEAAEAAETADAEPAAAEPEPEAQPEPEPEHG